MSSSSAVKVEVEYVYTSQKIFRALKRGKLNENKTWNRHSIFK